MYSRDRTKIIIKPILAGMLAAILLLLSQQNPSVKAETAMPESTPVLTVTPSEEPDQDAGDPTEPVETPRATPTATPTPTQTLLPSPSPTSTPEPSPLPYLRPMVVHNESL